MHAGIAEKMKFIKGKMDIQRAPNAKQLENGVDDTAVAPIASIKATPGAL
jgi:hypothetical protein